MKSAPSAYVQTDNNLSFTNPRDGTEYKYNDDDDGFDFSSEASSAEDDNDDDDPESNAAKYGSGSRVHRRGDSPPVDKDEFTRHRHALPADDELMSDDEGVASASLAKECLSMSGSVTQRMCNSNAASSASASASADSAKTSQDKNRKEAQTHRRIEDFDFDDDHDDDSDDERDLAELLRGFTAPRITSTTTTTSSKMMTTTMDKKLVTQQKTQTQKQRSTSRVDQLRQETGGMRLQRVDEPLPVK